MPREKWELSKSTGEGGTQELGFQLNTLSDGKSAGVQIVRLHCGGMYVDVLPTRGMGIWQANYAGLRIGWDSPVRGPVHPNWVPISEPSGLGWLEGFDEMMVRCGLCSNGAPQHDENGVLEYPLHGRISNLPARDVTVEVDHADGLIRISGNVEETRFLFHHLRLRTAIQLRLADPERISIVDQITNLGGTPTDFQLLYHTNIGSPLLEEGATFLAPINKLTPRDPRAANGIDTWDTYEPPERGFAEQVYFMQLAADENSITSVLLQNRKKSLGVSMDFNVQQLPCFTLWKNTASIADGYVTGMEPGTNFPNQRRHEELRHRTIELGPDESANFELAIRIHKNESSVSRMRERINDLGGEQQILCEPSSS